MSFLDRAGVRTGGDRKAWTRTVLIVLAALALVVAILYYTVSGDYAFLRASILTGSPTGAYHALGERLAARALKKNGHLKVVATAWSIENIAAPRRPKTGAAFPLSLLCRMACRRPPTPAL